MKWQRITGTVLIALCGLALIGSASAKFAQVPSVVTQMNAFGFQGKLQLIATGEALSAVLLLVPRTRSIGLQLVSGLLGGAIATHMQHGQPYVGPAVLLLVVWLYLAAMSKEFFVRQWLRRCHLERGSGSWFGARNERDPEACGRPAERHRARAGVFDHDAVDRHRQRCSSSDRYLPGS